MTTIYFDLDGTLSDLFSVPNWRERLAARDSTPYRVARPLCPLESLRERLARYHAAGYKLGIISWCSMGGDESFDEAVKTAKIDWLKEHDILKYFDVVHIMPYGTPKHQFMKRGDILVDDDSSVRAQWNKWGGVAIDMKELFNDDLT